MAEASFGIKGLADLRRVLRRMEGGLQKDLARRLKEAAEPVAAEARRIAPKRSRRLERSIKPFARGNVAGVRASAVARSAAYPRGFAYPRRLEYGRPSRPFLLPALQARRDEVERRVAQVLDDLARDWAGR